jgi:acyl carrier protein
LSATEAQVAAIVQDVCSRTRVGEDDYDTLLKDLGVDSLDVASIFLAIQEKLGVRVPDDEIDALNTVRLIAGYLDAKK